jgi:hypothetical protein
MPDQPQSKESFFTKVYKLVTNYFSPPTQQQETQQEQEQPNKQETQQEQEQPNKQEQPKQPNEAQNQKDTLHKTFNKESDLNKHGELEEQKAKQKAKEEQQPQNNKNYSRTSTGETQQSGMSTSSKIGNAAVLGGAIASAAAIPFVGWIVALAILYSFKDKFKDDPKANKEFEEAAKSNGLKDDELQKLKNEVAQLKERELKKTTTPEDNIITDLGKYLVDKPDGIKEITNILKEKDNKEELKKFFEEKLYKDKKLTNEQKKGIEDLINSDDANKTVKEVIENIKKNQDNVNEEKKEIAIYQSATFKNTFKNTSNNIEKSQITH